MKTLATVVLAMLYCVTIALCQTETATISGRVTDSSGAAISGAEVQVQNVLTGGEVRSKTNASGLYVVTALQPGTFRVIVTNPGFKQIVKPNVVLNVQDNASLNFSMTIGSVSETVTVEGGAPLVDTQSAAVSTVIDRNFAENLPMNGRSFQTLVQLTPGVVLATSNANDNGQFNINGQRAASNYWMLDGVSANIGIGVNIGGVTGNSLGGSIGSFSALGGTNSLVSVDAMQEFRIQTSTYAPEFGRTPGGQISIVTRSGTNQFHGSVFDYLRNDVLDANNWFNGYTNNPPLPKARERQNDFGGTFSGPFIRNRTFFFFSYEGLRLRLPQTTLTTVPDLNARQTAAAAMQPFLNAYPLDSNQPDLGNGIAQFNASHSNPGSLDAYSLRVDHKLRNRVTLFGRYSYSPSNLRQRGLANSLNTVFTTDIITQTATAGVTWELSSVAVNDLRFNYSRATASGHYDMDNFGGATPLTSLPFPSSFTARNGLFYFQVRPLELGAFHVGHVQDNLQRQINVVDGLSSQVGSHSFKFGVDFRRLSPRDLLAPYLQSVFFMDMPSAQTGNLAFSNVSFTLGPTFQFRNLGFYVQDTWRIVPRLTVTYGLRWDVEFPPTSIEGPGLAAVTGFDLNNLSKLALAPAGTSPFETTYGNVAPRIGVAYQLSQSQNWQTVLRGGFGVFYDLATSEAGNLVNVGNYPFSGSAFLFSGTFPLSAAEEAPPPITPPNANNFEPLLAFDPHLRLPYTLEWNVALQQALGSQQTLSVSYVGSAGRRLIQTSDIFNPNPSYSEALLIGNTASSDYNALQAQFQRRLSHGLQTLASYTWSHSVDTGSAGSEANSSNVFVSTLGSNANRGASDFDVRNAFSVGLTYDVPSLRSNAVSNAILHGWSIESIIQARSAAPVNVQDTNFFEISSFFTSIRPDAIPGQPFYLYGSQCAATFQVPTCPGAKGLNPAAFRNPPTDSSGNPLRQGDLPRNALRGFGAAQWDFAVHREFPIHESVRFQFRAEMFNVLNHPNFGQPSGQFGSGGFGLSNQMLASSLGGSNQGSGGLSPLYQIGGPRSIQFGLKLVF